MSNPDPALARSFNIAAGRRPRYAPLVLKQPGHFGRPLEAMLDAPSFRVLFGVVVEGPPWVRPKTLRSDPVVEPVPLSGEFGVVAWPVERELLL